MARIATGARAVFTVRGADDEILNAHDNEVDALGCAEDAAAILGEVVEVYDDYGQLVRRFDGRQREGRYGR